MKKLVGVLLGLVVVVIIAAVGILTFSNTNAGPLSDAAKNAKAAAANAVFDATDIKGQIKDTLDENRDQISSATGLSDSELDTALKNIDIDSWQAVTLPSDAVEKNTVSGNYRGVKGSITTYEDQNYVTIQAYGQKFTLRVPPSAQAYLPYLSQLK